MIEKDHFFKRAGIEFAIAAKFQSDLGEAIRFPRGVDPEGVGFPLRYSVAVFEIGVRRK
jgi:hypothetical protein